MRHRDNTSPSHLHWLLVTYSLSCGMISAEFDMSRGTDSFPFSSAFLVPAYGACSLNHMSYSAAVKVFFCNEDCTGIGKFFELLICIEVFYIHYAGMVSCSMWLCSNDWPFVFLNHIFYPNHPTHTHLNKPILPP